MATFSETNDKKLASVHVLMAGDILYLFVQTIMIIIHTVIFLG